VRAKGRILYLARISLCARTARGKRPPWNAGEPAARTTSDGRKSPRLYLLTTTRRWRIPLPCSSAATRSRYRGSRDALPVSRRGERQAAGTGSRREQCPTADVRASSSGRRKNRSASIARNDQKPRSAEGRPDFAIWTGEERRGYPISTSPRGRGETPRISGRGLFQLQTGTHEGEVCSHTPETPDRRDDRREDSARRWVSTAKGQVGVAAVKPGEKGLCHESGSARVRTPMAAIFCEAAVGKDAKGNDPARS